MWVPSDIDAGDPAQRVVEAAAQLPGYGGVTGWAGLSWLGGVWFGGVVRGGELLPVPLAVSSGHRMRSHHGLDVSQEVIAPRYVLRSGGVRVTHPLWSVAFEMRRARDDEAAVVAFDMAAFSDLVSIQELAAFLDTDLVARRGVERLRRVLPLLDENAWSPMEPVMRLAWHEEMHGPRLLTNVPVFDRNGRFVGTPDAIDPAAGVYGMYDGGLTSPVRSTAPRVRAARRAGVPRLGGRRTPDASMEDDDVAGGAGPPRTRSEIAAVRGALWARSDRQAALLLTMVVQQGVAPADRIGQALLQVKRDRRLTFVIDVVTDLLGGVRSLAELDFARECRRRGLPEPTRQVVRRGRDGRYYLDVVWEEWGLVVEVDGIHHALAQEVVADALRHNDVTLGNLTVLRLPVLGLRVAADDFFDQIERAWSRRAARDSAPPPEGSAYARHRGASLPSSVIRSARMGALRMTLAVQRPERHTNRQVWVRLRMTLAAPERPGAEENAQGRKMWATQ